MLFQKFERQPRVYSSATQEVAEKTQSPLTHEEHSVRESYKDALVQSFAESVSLPHERIAQIEVFQCVPVGSFEDPHSVDRLIREHAAQSLAPRKRALVLFVNGHNDSDQNIVATIQRAQHTYPECTIIPLVHRWQHKDAFSVGMMRAVPTETVRALYQRAGGKGDPLIVSNDADTISMRRHYLKKLNAEVHAGTLAGDLSRFEFSGTNVLYDLNLSLDDIDRELRNGMLKDSDPFGRRPFYPPGSNSAFRLSDYNGYNLEKIKGEDSELARDFISRGKQIRFVEDIPVYTDSRRIVNAFNRGKFVHEAWQTWESSGENGRRYENLEPCAYDREKFELYLNAYFTSRALGFYQSRYNKCSTAEFIKKTNSYVAATLNALKPRLRSIGVPDLFFEHILLPPVEDGGSLEESVHSHTFVRVHTVV